MKQNEVILYTNAKKITYPAVIMKLYPDGSAKIRVFADGPDLKLDRVPYSEKPAMGKWNYAAVVVVAPPPVDPPPVIPPPVDPPPVDPPPVIPPPTGPQFYVLPVPVSIPGPAVTPKGLPALNPNAAVSICTVKVENNNAQELVQGFSTFAMPFKKGDLQPGDKLANIQMDVKVKHDDGSVRHAVLTLMHGPLNANESKDFAIGKSVTSHATHEFDFSDLALTVTLKLLGKTIDLAPMVKASTDLWMNGPYAVQKRAEVMVEKSLRLVVDATKYANGLYLVDVQFCNDIAMSTQGGNLKYDAEINCMGEVYKLTAVNHYQYSAWHKVFTQARQAHVKHDPKYIIESRAVLPYRLDLQLDQNEIKEHGEQSKNPHVPFDSYSITRYMPMTGDRGNIGELTSDQMLWLLTGDEGTKRHCLHGASASLGIPWRYYDKANNHWLSVDEYPYLWTDGRGGTGTPGDRNSGGLTQQVQRFEDWWAEDTAHKPSLNYLPYLLTGTRLYLDSLNAECSFDIMGHWTAPRNNWDNEIKNPEMVGLVANGNQIRGSAWSMRDIGHAAYINPDGSWAKTHYSKMLVNNLKYIKSTEPQRTADQGELRGTYPGSYGHDNNGALPPWQNDHVGKVLSLMALQGHALAKEVLEFNAAYLVDRVLHPDANPRNAVCYNYFQGKKDESGNLVLFKTWKEADAHTEAVGAGNGSGWAASGGNYGQLGLACLAAMSRVGIPGAKEAFEKIRSLNPPYTEENQYQNAGGARNAIIP